MAIFQSLKIEKSFATRACVHDSFIIFLTVSMKKTIGLILLLIGYYAHSQDISVNINGNNFAVYIKGLEKRKPNTPVLIFENGMGIGYSNWNTVINQLAEVAPVFAYDRAGVEKSDKIYEMPTPKRTADNLKAILNKLNILPPYIIVGHSMGGVYARAFAGHYPSDIEGLVFVDPADFTESKDGWNQIFREIGVPEKKIDEMLYNRLYKPTQGTARDSLNFGPWSEAQVLNSLRKTDFAEINALPIPNVPIYFLVGGKFEVPPERRSKDYNQERFFHVKNDKNMERWRALIHASNKGGMLIYLANCGHYIHKDDPAAVIAGIKLLLTGLSK